jgi:hypothetical protein
MAIRNNKPVDGVKGTCALFNLQHYKPVSGTCIDYMHSVLEGVVKNFFKYWFDAQYAGENFTLIKHEAEINDRLFRIKPPSFVPYTPRSIDTWKQWRAHEYLNFIIYYSLPVLWKIMKNDQLNNLTKLVVFLEIILQKDIPSTDLATAQKIIQDFVFELPHIYSSSMLLSGVHELLHLVECTEQFGHLNSVNCFVFEELNRKVTSFIHGKDLIGEEFIKIFTTAQAFAVSAENVNVQTNIGQFIQEFSQFKTSNRKKQYRNRKIRINKIEVSTSPKLLALYRKFNNQNDLESLNITSRVTFNGVHYNSSKIETKRCDSCFKDENNNFGLIECFIIDEKKIFVVAKKINELISPFHCHQMDAKASIKLCFLSNQLFIVEIQYIHKCTLMQLDESELFVSTFSTSHLFN